ncbi:MAG TPA: amino acid ABC transporter substrate-binding protein [Desulfobacteraceae bacterium]|nr:amino acid ABC transporter substrate-binding protein [Desulfobacteraceae bacterium]
MKAWLIKLVALLCCLIPVSVSAQTFSIMTEEYPPFNYTEEGKLTGLSSEVMAELIKRMGHPDNIKVLPWARAYNFIQNKEGMILFSMTRTEQRESLFKWVGPVAINKWVFFAKKGSGIQVASLDDARNVKKIGAYKDDAAEQFLKNEGFTNIESVVDDLSNVKKLAAGRIDLWIVGELQGIFKAKSVAGDAAAFEKVFDIKETQLYIAFSKTTPDSVIAKWQAELDKMKADGTYDAILKKYM